MFQLIRSYVDDKGNVSTATESTFDLSAALIAASIYIKDRDLCAISIIDRDHDVDVLNWVQ